MILERLLITRLLRELSLPRLSEYSSHVISLRWRIGFVGVLFSPKKRAERFRKPQRERKLLAERHIANWEIFFFAGRRKSFGNPDEKEKELFLIYLMFYIYICVCEYFRRILRGWNEIKNLRSIFQLLILNLICFIEIGVCWGKLWDVMDDNLRNFKSFFFLFSFTTFKSLISRSEKYSQIFSTYNPHHSQSR